MIRRGFILPSGAEFVALKDEEMKKFAIHVIETQEDLKRRYDAFYMHDPIRFLVEHANAIMVDGNTVTVSPRFLGLDKEVKGLLWPYLSHHFQIKVFSC